jgi:hippurate hydrolase
MTAKTAPATLVAEAMAWRRDLHAIPELMFDLPETAAYVAARLEALGVDEVVRGVGRSGVVGILRGRGPGRCVALRSDMDALPIREESGAPWASRHAGRMHACGHDGHMAMLLGAAAALAADRDFPGSVALVFQPAEEGGGGGRVMVEEGMMERFAIEEVYGMHNLPGLPLGRFALRPGPIMAAADRFRILVRGRGGHAAKPHETVDPVLVAAHVVLALQSIVARGVDPTGECVVSVTAMEGGKVFNIIPDEVSLIGTVRTLDPAVRDHVEARLAALATGVAASFGASAEVDYRRGYPVTRNHPAETRHAAAAAVSVAGPGMVDAEARPMMGAEDFAYMLEARPGAFIFIGNGESAPLHSARYDFDDAAIGPGIAYWTALARSRLAA